MNKLTRKDLGLDVEGYKDYVNNLKIFAKYQKDYEMLADDGVDRSLQGALNGLLSSQGERDGNYVSEETLERARVLAAWKDSIY